MGEATANVAHLRWSQALPRLGQGLQGSADTVNNANIGNNKGIKTKYSAAGGKTCKGGPTGGGGLIIIINDWGTFFLSRNMGM